MKKLFFTLTIVFAFGVAVFAQSPEAINYQAVARDGAGVLLNTANLDVRVSILSGVGGATLEYEETHAVTTNQYGLFTLKIGEGTPTSGTFASIDWGNDEHHLKIEINPGSGYLDLGTTQMVSVPYALYAKSAGSAANSVWNNNGSNIYYDLGYVGIGTTNPGAGLEVKSSAGYGSGISLNNTGGGLEWRFASWTDGTLRIVKTSGTTFSPLVIEPLDGYIGIGTSTPDMPLSVHTSSGISYIRVSDNTTGPTSGLRMGLSGSGNAYIINDEPVKSLSLGTNGTTQVRINSDGEVGINDLSPDQTLHVKQMVSNKGIRIEHNSTTDYWENGIGVTTKNYKFYYNNLFRADISSTDGSYTQSSDRRLKKDIKYMEPVLDRVMKLKPATYHYIDNDENDPLSTGFIAQEVMSLFPNLVRDVDEGYKGLVYDGFAVISIKAIQEMQTEIEQMQSELEALKQAVKELQEGQ